MNKDEKIKIKLEVCKDKFSGKLSIMAHFNSTAPNVFQDKDGYFWIPTVEEKDFLSEAFELMPIDSDYSSPYKNNSKSEENKEIKPISEPSIQDELKPLSENKPDEDHKSPDLPTIDKPDDSSTTEEKANEINTDDLVKEIDKKIEEHPTETDDKDKKDIISDELEKKEKDDEGIIVEANSDTIEAALNKDSDKDKSIIEADEQTIVDKVLSQKKKGKWSRK